MDVINWKIRQVKLGLSYTSRELDTLKSLVPVTKERAVQTRNKTSEPILFSPQQSFENRESAVKKVISSNYNDLPRCTATFGRGLVHSGES